MNDMTIESLAQRVTELESRLAAVESRNPSKDWRSAIGIFEVDSEGIREIIDEGRRIREADRKLAADPNGEESAANDASNPWLQFGGMFRDDPIFAEVVEIMEENRRQEDAEAQ